MKILCVPIGVAIALMSSLTCAANADKCGAWMEEYDIIPFKSWGSTPESVKESWGDSNCNVKVCRYMKETYDVVPDKSWGSLPKSLQRAWTSAECNDKVD